MNRPDEFDAFYKETRSRLLLQTYALTGDLPASRSAVRDTFVVAWHHWREDLPAGRPRELGPPARLVPRAAPPHRAHLAPRQGPGPGGEGHPRGPREAPGRAAQGAAADPPGQRQHGRHGPRGRAPPRRGRAGAADRDRPVRGPPRRRDHQHPPALRAAARADRERDAGRARRSSAGPAPPGGVPTRSSASASPSPPWSVSGSLVTDAGRRPTEPGPGTRGRPRRPTSRPEAQARAARGVLR